MVVTVLNKLRTFNTHMISLPFDVQWSGFENIDVGRHAPFPEATREIGRDDVRQTVDIAARGDVRIISRDPLTSAELVSINQTLDTHDDTIDDARQARQRSLAADIDALKVTHDAGIADLIMRRVVRRILDDAGVNV